MYSLQRLQLQGWEIVKISQNEQGGYGSFATQNESTSYASRWYEGWVLITFCELITWKVTLRFFDPVVPHRDLRKNEVSQNSSEPIQICRVKSANAQYHNRNPQNLFLSYCRTQLYRPQNRVFGPSDSKEADYSSNMRPVQSG